MFQFGAGQTNYVLNVLYVQKNTHYVVLNVKSCETNTPYVVLNVKYVEKNTYYVVINVKYVKKNVMLGTLRKIHIMWCFMFSMLKNYTLCGA